VHRVHQMRYSTLAERCSIAGAAAACPPVRLRAITDGMDCKLNGGSHACMHTRMHISRMSNMNCVRAARISISLSVRQCDAYTHMYMQHQWIPGKREGGGAGGRERRASRIIFCKEEEEGRSRCCQA
jgi:hypothetical protein